MSFLCKPPGRLSIFVYVRLYYSFRLIYVAILLSFLSIHPSDVSCPSVFHSLDLHQAKWNYHIIKPVLIRISKTNTGHVWYLFECISRGESRFSDKTSTIVLNGTTKEPAKPLPIIPLHRKRLEAESHVQPTRKNEKTIWRHVEWHQAAISVISYWFQGRPQRPVSISCGVHLLCGVSARYYVWRFDRYVVCTFTIY